MTGEITRAYPRLRREWQKLGGRLTRMGLNGENGIPDWFLAHTDCGAILCEVKCVAHAKDLIELKSAQADYLDKHATLFNVHAKVLVLTLDKSMWGVFDAGALLPRYNKLRYEDADRFAFSVTPMFLTGGAK